MWWRRNAKFTEEKERTMDGEGKKNRLKTVVVNRAN